ncbi:MAG TPA: hypothetical protein VG015_08695 [Candidatus Dormibacteraeota bacterium]|nr:hypothetical protein [Candidatus Dormibacteraeota bacterium]
MSWAPAEVLVLEDEPEQAEALAGAIRQTRLDPLVAANPRQALSLLRYHHPVLALVDLDMSKAEYTGRTVNEVLACLETAHGSCVVMVYSANAETIEQQAKVFAIHAGALFQSKRDGEAALIKRINRLLSARYGDLMIHNGGSTIHVPSGQRWPHRVLASLVMASRTGKTVFLNDSDTRAVRRTRVWLEQVGSVVQVRNIGPREYDLISLAAIDGDDTATSI